MRFLATLLALAVNLVITAVEGLLWLLFGGRRLLSVGRDAWQARRALLMGELCCPRGHVVPIHGEVCECSHCGFIYEGSTLVCANPECGQVSPYVNCPTCGLSVRNPYRWGRP